MRSFFVFNMVMASCLASLACGQDRVAAYDALDVPKAGQQVTFAKQAAQPGDRVEQSLEVQLQLESTVRQGDKQLDQSTTTMVRDQQRTVIAGEIIDGRTVEARVRFAKCTRGVDGKVSEPPVVGNTYLCRRLEDDTLRVTRDDGSFASPDEFSVVSESMHSLGRPNPLADYLVGKTVTVGDMLEVPLEVGAALLGSNDSLGHVSRFQLVLREITPGDAVAKFAIEMETEGSEKTQMRLIVTGDLEVEVDSCRTRRMAISGPLAMASTMGSYSTAQTTLVRGKLKLAMSAQYR